MGTILDYFAPPSIKKNVCCMHSLEWPHLGNFNEYTQHTFSI